MHEDHSDCEKIQASLSDYVDGELAKGLCIEIEKHLVDCENCQMVVNTLRKTVDLYRASSENTQVSASVMQRNYMRDNHDHFLSR